MGLLLLLSVLFCCVHVIASNSAEDKVQIDSVCSINSELNGTCQYFYNCPNSPKSGAIKLCGYDGYAHIICCPLVKQDLPAAAPLQEGDACNNDAEQRGICTHTRNCSSLVASSDTVEFCEMESFLVCCLQESAAGSGSSFDISKSVTYNRKFKGPGCLTKYKPGAFCRNLFFCMTQPEEQIFYVCGWDDFTPKICCSETFDSPTISPVMLNSSGEEGSACDVTDNKRGTCELVINCKTYPEEGVITVCGWERSMPLICCPDIVLDKAENFTTDHKSLASPIQNKTIECGLPRHTSYKEGYTLNGRNGTYSFYVLNRTADILRSRGYTLRVVRMSLDDIDEMHATKGNRKFVFAKEFNYAISSTSSASPDAIKHAQYMASLGVQLSGKIQWLCDGVVINNEWVLSAAHCFVKKDSKPNVIRLGVYQRDLTFFDDPHDYVGVEEFGLLDIVFYPDFDSRQGYHDIVLIRLDRPVPLKNHYITPICLPWGIESTRRFIGKTLTLTGWGIANYLKDQAKVLQKINQTLFDTTVCDESYSTLGDYGTKWPAGMDSERIICAGSDRRSNNNCIGSSGAPLIYLDSLGRFTLVGISSENFGCGFKGFKTLFTPITVHKYLDWIKMVAF